MATPRIDRMDRNHIINGGMDFWQRVGANTTTVNTASTTSNYTSDRMSTYSEGPTVKNYSILRSTSVPSAAQAGALLPFSRRFNCLTAIASPAAADRVLSNSYPMEGQDAQALYGRTVTFGFWINTNVQGNHPFAVISTLAPIRSYVTSFNISASESSTWVFKTVTIPIESAGAIGNSMGLGFYIGGSFGSTYQTTVGSWQTGTFHSFSGAANLMSLNTNFMQITGLQLIVGSTLPSGSFARAGKSLGQELQLCQRYYEKTYDIDVAPGTITDTGRVSFHSATGFSAMSNLSWFSQEFKVTKRAVPSVSPYATTSNLTPRFADSSGVVRVCSADQIGTNRWSWKHLDAVNSTGIFMHWTADAEL